MSDALGHYKILERIGAGGLGDVYRARDTRLGRTVAIKVPADDLQSDAARREALLRDAGAALVLSHPNIATLYEIGDEHGKAFLVFEFAPGETLTRVIAGLPMNPRRAVDVAAQIADALADAHASDLVHGRIGADAVIVTPKGNAKILDFGFARWTRSATSSVGEGLDERADVTALGRLLFEMLTGKPPVSGQPAGLNTSLPDELRAIVSKALAAEGDAYRSAATLGAELRSVAAILDVRSTTEAVRVAPVRSRRPVKWQEPWIVAAVLLAFAALAGAVWWLFSRPVRISARRAVNADRASTSSTPAARAASMRSACT
jgi:eukaryotic-like serine/threonine-protein kinase